MAALVLVATPALVFATERPKATLEFVRQGRAAEDCPDEATFRALVAAKLGYDPFVADAPSAMRVVLRRSGPDLSGNLTMSSGPARRGERTLRAPSGDCYELAASLALAAAVAIDPDSVAQRSADGSSEPRPPEPASASASVPPPPPPSPPPAAPPPTPAAPAHAAQRKLGPRFSAGAFVPWGVTPAVTVGARLGVGLDADTWLLGLEGSATLESSRDSDAGIVTARLFDAALVPCLRPTLGDGAALTFCAVGRLGVLSSDAEQVTRSTAQTDLWAAVGPRAGLELFPWRAFGFGLDAELPLSFSRVHLVIDEYGEQQEVWASSRVGMMAAFSVIFRPR